ncbi:hypothetical protein [Desulfosporosinus sp. SB140]|uniref:hypothetical protein n=1 Tax=Desulfosporosinus paludis TaxID=3115649 RepID=UPI00389055AF
MKKIYLFLLLVVIAVPTSILSFKAGYSNSAKAMVDVFETSKAIVAAQLPKDSNPKFSYLTDSHVKSLGDGKYEVDSYVDYLNNAKHANHIQYSMTLHWDGQKYDLVNLTSESTLPLKYAGTPINS